MNTNLFDKIEIISNISALSKEINKISNTYLQFDDLNVSQRAILELLYKEKSLTVPNIAKKYGVSRQHIQVNINLLVEKKLLLQEDNKLHKRSKLISLTKKAIDLFKEISEFEEKFISDLFKDIDDKDIETTNNTLEMILKKSNEILIAIKA